MATIVRVKRKRSCKIDPAEALVLSCKKPKCDSNELVTIDTLEPKSPLSDVVKYVGTVSCEDAVSPHIKRVIDKHQLESSYKSHHVDPVTKSRLQQRSASKTSRYKLISGRRSNFLHDFDTQECDVSLDKINALNERTKSDSYLTTPITLPDHENVVQSKLSNSDPSLSDKPTLENGQNSSEVKKLKNGVESHQNDEVLTECFQEETDCDKGNNACTEEYGHGVFSLLDIEDADAGIHTPSTQATEEYVYDLYYTTTHLDLALFDPDILCIEAVGMDDLDFRVGGHEEEYGEDSDSNDEDNWRNDYPDEENDHSFYGNGYHGDSYYNDGSYGDDFDGEGMGVHDGYGSPKPYWFRQQTVDPLTEAFTHCHLDWFRQQTVDPLTEAFTHCHLETGVESSQSSDED